MAALLSPRFVKDRALPAAELFPQSPAGDEHFTVELVKHVVPVGHRSLCLFQAARRNTCLHANLKCGVGVGAELSQLRFVGFILSSKRSSQMCGQSIMSCGSEGCDRVASSERSAVVRT